AARRVAAERREQRRRQLRRMRPRLPDRRTGRWVLRRSWSERLGIAFFTALAIAVIWFAVPLPTGMRIGMIIVLLLGLPAFVVIALDRRV
ncbi:MAG: hypothetical protein ACRDT6_03750, partial [Micromonosporaceae bacterium]